jgi:GDP-4-dehydro-6-deoxy-D-mannose reductase
MNCLITGCSGLIGPFLAEYLLARNATVWGTYHSTQPNLISCADRVKFLPCDVQNASDVERVISQSRPDRIFHLAAQSYPLVSWTEPEATMRTNSLGTLHLLEAIRRHVPECRLLAFGSSAEYGSTGAQSGSIPETSVLEPDNPYGVSKVAADLLSDVYARAYGMNVLRVRPFLLIGPARATNVFTEFAKMIVNIENGVADRLLVGNVAAVRDIVDVRDAVRAIWTISDNGEKGAVYNLCSGQGRSIREGLDILCALAKCKVRTVSDPTRFRPLDTPVLVGDASSLRQLGWTPEISFQDTLRDILEFWRNKAAQTQGLVASN